MRSQEGTGRKDRSLLGDVGSARFNLQDGHEDEMEEKRMIQAASGPHWGGTRHEEGGWNILLPSRRGQ